jgi:hypothetical protein
VPRSPFRVPICRGNRREELENDLNDTTVRRR